MLLAVKVHLKIAVKRRLILSTDHERVKTRSGAFDALWKNWG